MMDIFKALGNKNRALMLKLLMRKQLHISGIAKELGISVPVTLRHARVLESEGLVERQKLGTTHVLKIREEAGAKLRKVWGLFEKPLIIEVQKGAKILEALRKISGIKIEETMDGAFISEVDGKKGYFVFEVNGKIPQQSPDKLEVKGKCEIELKQLLPVVGKKIVVKVV